MAILISRKAKKQLARLPDFIQEKFLDWVDMVEEVGLARVRIFKGYHDEPLKGVRTGQRSVRLTKAYRIFYIELDQNIEVLEVNKHDY